MKALFLFLHTTSLVLSVGITNFIFAADVPKATVARVHEAFLKTNCVKCHSAEKREGQVRLDDIPFELTSLEIAERWQKVLGALNSGEMPPRDEARPDEKSKTEFLADLSNALVIARKTIGDQGRIGVLRRLNRREYINSIRDLLGVETDAEGLPEDKGVGVFDTVGASLYMSSDQLDRYLQNGRAAVSSAIAQMRLVDQPPERKTVRTEAETDFIKLHAGVIHSHLDSYMALRKWQQNGEKPDALPKGFASVKEAKDALTLVPRRDLNWRYDYAALMLALPKANEGAYLTMSYYFNGNVAVVLPADVPPGKYVLRARVAHADSPNKSRFIELIYLEGGSRYQPRLVEAREVRSPLSKPEIVEFTVQVTPTSPRHYMIREKQYSDKEADHQKHLEEIFRGNGIGVRPAVWVDWSEWDGPIPDPEIAQRCAALLSVDLRSGPTTDGGTNQQESGKRSVLRDRQAADDPAAMRIILERFATRAFRGVVPKPSFVDKLVALQQSRRKAGDDLLASLVEPMAVVLASPRFLYLHEPAVASTPAAGQAEANSETGRTLTDLEFASRLSYLLWSAPPDELLLAAAKSGNLRKPEVLAAQVDRMIADPRSYAFASGFTHQWLSIDRLDFFPFDFRNYPKFDESTRVAARHEVYRTFHTLLTDNLDARKLLKSDFVVINSVMADYYGIAADEKNRPIAGMEFRKVAVPPGSPRGGLLGMACILAMGSNGSSTSPVERGAWVLRKLLNTPPPPAPANVPQLSRLAEQKLTARERIIAHQEQAQCAQCHRRLDPIGFGLENFDAAGLWREVDTYKPGEFLRRNNEGKLMVATYPIDPAGAFFNGPSFKNYDELRDLIAERGDGFLRGLIENLYEYALGRPTSFADAVAIDTLVVRAKKDSGSLKAIVKQLVLSDEFATK